MLPHTTTYTSCYILLHTTTHYDLVLVLRTHFYSTHLPGSLSFLPTALMDQAHIPVIDNVSPTAALLSLSEDGAHFTQPELTVVQPPIILSQVCAAMLSAGLCRSDTAPWDLQQCAAVKHSAMNVSGWALPESLWRQAVASRLDEFVPAVALAALLTIIAAGGVAVLFYRSGAACQCLRRSHGVGA